MKTRNDVRLGLWVLLLGLGCDVGVTTSPGLTSNDRKPSATTKAAVIAGLKVADAADGVEDKVAHRCAGCALQMDGTPSHVISHAGYALHMCSATCKSTYVSSLETNLTMLGAQ